LQAEAVLQVINEISFEKGMKFFFYYFTTDFFKSKALEDLLKSKKGIGSRSLIKGQIKFDLFWVTMKEIE
jgi:hypothetical protein